MLKKLQENKIVIVLFVVFLIIYLIAWNRGLELLYVIAELSLATLVLSLIAPYFNLLGINASMKHPRYSNQGQGIPITIELSTSGLFDKYLLEVWLKTPFSSNTDHMFFVKSLHKKLIIKSELSSNLRGVHQIGPLSIQTGFPLGLKVFKKIFEDTKSELVILPKPLKVKKFPFATDASSMLHGENKSKRKGGHDEFVSLREYKQGDSPRHIHWPVSAKKGELIVREYQDILPSNLIIILDLNKDFNRGVAQESTLEYAVTIAASLALYGLDRGYSVSLFGSGEEEIKLLDIKGAHNHMTILKTLAYADANTEENYSDVIASFLSLQKRGGTLVLFDNGSGNVERNIDMYASKFSKPVIFDIDADSFEKDAFDETFQVHHNPKYSKYSLKKGCDIARMFS